MRETLSSSLGSAARLTRRDATRFLTQAGFGPSAAAQVDALVAQGLDGWLGAQFKAPYLSHIDYINTQRGRYGGGEARVPEEASYEAIWNQWLWGQDPLRARVVWALLQFFVISNIAPDIRPHAMSSYMDLLARNAFGNWRTLLGEVSRSSAMGYYLTFRGNAKANASGAQPDTTTAPGTIIR